METNKIVLGGGRSAESVVRIGNTVHRSMSSNHAIIHKLLQHFHENDFEEAPEFLGISSENQEVLSYIDGEVPIGRKLSYAQISQCIKLLRRFHDTAATSGLREDAETVCHNDFAPWNIIFKDERPVGIIDFDDCKPGSRIEDVAYFLWTFLDLGTTENSEETQMEQIGELCKDYVLKNWSDLPDAIISQQNRILQFRRKIVATEEDKEKREFSANKIKEIEIAINWVTRNHNNIQEELSRVMSPSGDIWSLDI